MMYSCHDGSCGSCDYCQNRSNYRYGTPEPLGCDCYPGCWGEHSKHWHQLSPKSIDKIGDLMRLANKHTSYGRVVTLADHVRFQLGDDYIRVRKLAEENNLIEL